MSEEVPPVQKETPDQAWDEARKALSELPAEVLERMLQEAQDAKNLRPDVGITRDELNRLFPMKDVPPGVRQVHERAQLLAFSIVSHAAEKTDPDVGTAIRKLREACWFAAAAITR